MNRKISLIVVFLVIIVIVLFSDTLSLKKKKISQEKEKPGAFLSPHTCLVIDNLENLLVIKAYFSKSLPSEFADTQRFMQYLFEEYQAYSGGNLCYEFVDPIDDDALKEEAQKAQIKPMTMPVNVQDQLVLREVYMGLAFLYQDKMESIPFVQNTQGLEYDITKTIKKISAQSMKKLAFFSTDNEEGPIGRGQTSSPYQTVRQVVSESYELNDIDLTEPLTIDTDALMITSIADTLTETQLYNLDQYIMQGGKVILFQDRVTADIQNAAAEVNNTNLFDLLEHYGIVAKKNLVADAECGQIQIMRRQEGGGMVNTPVKYPYLPIITVRNENNPLVKNLDTIQMVFVSEIDTSFVKNTFEPLFYSSANSRQTYGPQFDIDYNNYMKKDLRQELNEGRKILGGIYSGTFMSYFANNPYYPDALLTTSEACIIFVPSRNFIREATVTSMEGNKDFAINAVNYLAGDEDLIKLRSKDAADEYNFSVINTQLENNFSDTLSLNKKNISQKKEKSDTFLSPYTCLVLDNLDNLLEIKAYFSNSLPGELFDTECFTLDILEEYQAYSEGNLRYEFVCTIDEEALKEEAHKAQIDPITLRINKQDQLLIRDIYMGLAFFYQDKVESIPIVQNTRGLEYDITNTIKKISAQSMKKLAFFSIYNEEVSLGNGQTSIPYQTVRQIVSESYELRDIDLTEPLTIDTDALMITSITDNLTETQLYNLDQYIMQGGKVILFQDRVIADIQNAAAEVNETNLFDLLEHYGIVAKKNLVADAECGQIQVTRQQGFYRFNTPVKYPYFPVITERNEKNPLVKNLDMIQMVFVSEIDTSYVKNTFEPLFYSSAHSGQASGPTFNINYNEYMEKDLQQELKEGKKILSGMYYGIFTSYFANDPAYPDAISETSDACIIFVPSGSFIREGAGAGIAGNMDFAVNAVDYLVGNIDFIYLRSKNAADYNF
ncbi:MAG: Gldg family protein [Candidatus Cloacimonetes bacterium]|nr:Gldg family protein [Candidatus Cloacimonadota bacterium]